MDHHTVAAVSGTNGIVLPPLGLTSSTLHQKIAVPVVGQS